MQTKKINWFKIIMILLFIGYMALYLLHQTGYYDGNIRKKVEFTESQIKEFEKDVKEGRVVDLEDYLRERDKDYTNKTSKLGITISTNIDKIMNGGIKRIVGLLEKFFT